MRKKILVGIVAVGIAVMLVALPYESNAIAPVLVGLGIGVAVGIGVKYLYDWLTDRHTSDNIQYDTNATAYINRWEGKFDNIENELSTIEHFANNEVNMLKQQNLYWVRYAERKSVDYLNYTNWTASIEENITEEFDNYVYNLSISIMEEYLNVLHELEFEINQLSTYNLPATSNYVYAQVYSSSGSSFNIGKYYDGGWKEVQIGKIYLLWGNPAYNSSEVIFNISNGEILRTLGQSRLIVANVDDVNNLLNLGVYVAFNDNISSFTVKTAKDTFFKLEDMFIPPSTSSSESDGKIEIWYRNNTQSAYTRWMYDDGFSWKVNLSDVYLTIRNNMITNAHSYWQYLKDKGYNDPSDIPEDELPVFPDLVFDNIDALGNLSFDDALLLYYVLLSQLNNTDLLNKTNLTDSDFLIANYTGKIAKITLLRWKGVDTYSTIIDADRCYILPLEDDLTLTLGGVYAITQNVSKLTAWNITGYYNVNASDITLVNQKVAIYDIDTKEYVLTYISDIAIYTFKVENLTEDNKSVNSITYDILDLGRFTSSRWGFRLSPIGNPNDEVVIPISDEDISGFFAKYKNLLMIGSIVLGILLMASSRRSSGSYTLGVLLFIIGIAMAFYWYILPAWHGFTGTLHKLNPLNWFK